MVVQFEATAKECVAIALSPVAGFKFGCTYVVHFGASHNLSTVIRRRISEREHVDASSSCRVCSESKFMSYWIVLQDGWIKCGVGNVVGENVVCEMNDSLYHTLRSGIDAPMYVGIGNSAVLDNRNTSESLRVRNLRLYSPPEGMNVKSMPSPSNEFISFVDDGDDVMGGGTQDIELLTLMKEYANEVNKARARAEKFGTEFKEPPPDAFFQWSEARKMRANPSAGFITGIDLASEEEKRKQLERKKRFASESNEPKKRKQGSDDEEDGNDSADEQNDTVIIRAGIINAIEAWDNEELLRKHRFDPYKAGNDKDDDMDNENGDTKEIRIGEEIIESFPSDEVSNYQENIFPEVKTIPEKIHLQCLDWAAFKQIRTNDLMCHFALYGPSYIEWLGDLACNIVFADQHSASRAINALTSEIPSPPPPEKEGHVDFGKMGWRICRYPVRKVADDSFGRRGTTSRYIVRIATSTDFLEEKPAPLEPPPGFSRRHILGPGSDFRKKARNKTAYKGLARNESYRTQRKKRSKRESDTRQERGDYRAPDLDSALRCPR